ncbi:hypothetical protein RHGRI_031805 [Rhododendron griersonianum]|uniref:Bulb-type lectin domain-containing protein n=1 Tax=Rhododendron griersonianum TaxID=479676 RepID=A0AAV6I969_9ERIC|nr:hypothetical protein RHGRI_031805 [Rhododendron griersonianum]
MNPEKWVFNLLLPFLFIRFCTSIDTLTPTQFIKDGDVLVSSGETFALGFFSPGNSSRRRNLVLFQGDRGSGGVVWQSFDHPTNTLLPNMKLGLDRRTGLEWFLTSWKSRDDPGTGEYSYRVEPNELPQLILFKGSTRVWRIP